MGWNLLWVIPLGIYILWYWAAGPGRGMKTVTKRSPRGSFNRTFGSGGTSKMVPKPGWWQASDGKWYPPHQNPKRRRLPPPPGKGR